MRAVVDVTSDKCYENREWPWAYREDEPLGGHDPYCGSRPRAELVTGAYRRSFFAGPGGHRGWHRARAGNVIGGGDWAEDRLVPDVVRAALAGEPVALRNPHAVRPWQHVLDPLSGYLVLAEALVRASPSTPGGWNFGPVERRRAARCAGSSSGSAERWAGGLRVGRGPGPAPARGPPPQARLLASPRAARLAPALGPRRRRWTALVDWYAALRGGEDMRAVTLAQIERIRPR